MLLPTPSLYVRPPSWPMHKNEEKLFYIQLVNYVHSLSKIIPQLLREMAGLLILST